MALERYGSEVTSVFDMLGRHEVDLTAALGWTLSRSPALVRQLWSSLGLGGAPGEVDVALESADQVGRTDIEIWNESTSVIIEAKQGWLVPSQVQFERYAGRLMGAEDLLVSLSDSSREWAKRTLPDRVGGVPVVHLPWDVVRSSITLAIAETRRQQERLWLEQLGLYLKGATSMRERDSQWVYVVSVSPQMRPEGSPHNFVEFVTRERVYFHPFGKGWPKRPPNFLGFRWNGRLQQVNRVQRFEVVPTLHDHWPEVERIESDDPYRLHHLGPDIPIRNIRVGAPIRNRRLWVLLDQLLTQETIVAAEQESSRLAR